MLTVTMPPVEEFVGLEAAKKHLRVDHDYDDDYIQGLIVAARQYCEGYQNKTYLQAGYEWAVQWAVVGTKIKLPMPPIVSVQSVSIDGTLLEDSGYSLQGQVLTLGSVAQPNGTSELVIRYTAGVNDAQAIPQMVKQAILLLVGHWYESREAVLVGSVSKAIEFTVDALLNLDRGIPI